MLDTSSLPVLFRTEISQSGKFATVRISRFTIVVVVVWMICLGTRAEADEQLNLLGSSIQDVQEASAVLHTLSTRRDLALAEVLVAMNGQNAVAKNWYLSLAQIVADRDPIRAEHECLQLVQQTGQDPSARYWAFCFFTNRHPERREQMLEAMVSDPCPELRYEAIQLQLKRLEESTSVSPENKDAAYRDLLMAARLPSQIGQIAALLKESSQPINLVQHFGFITDWYTVGPFDNSGQKGFEVVYDPEREYLGGKLVPTNELLASQGYQGKVASVRWTTLSTTQEEGEVDLKSVYEKEKGSVVYALGSFHSAAEMNGEVRIGSPNAVKVWVNGQELISREVYHAGAQIDQYTAPIALRTGENTILVKVCQNEQTEDWAQIWYFQLRLCDSTGLAIRPFSKSTG